MHRWLAFALLVSVYGTGFMFINIAVEQLTPAEANAGRFTLGAILLTATLYIRGERLPLDRTSIRDFIVIGLMNNAVPFLLVAWAQTQGVNSGLTGVLIATNTLFSLIVAHLVFDDERMTALKALGVAVGFGGVIILASRNIEGGEVLTEGLLGQAAVVASALMFALSAAYSRRMMQRRHTPPLVIATGTILVAMIVTDALVLFQALTGSPPPAPADLEFRTIFAIVELTVANTFIAFITLFYVIRELGVTRTSMMAYLIPVISLAAGALFLDETIDGRTLAGTAVILSAIAIVNAGPVLLRRIRRKHESPIPAGVVDGP
jgi:drug/metabolite transporter (DMT)-like permease